MNHEQIVFTNRGVTLLGFPVGVTPSGRDFAIALEGEEIRELAPLNGRVLRVCDAKGLSWLVDLKQDLVLWFDILLAKLKYRPKTDHDPSCVFKGNILFSQYTTQGPFSFETGEIVRKIVIPNISFNFVPDAKLIRAVTVGFNLNERKVNQRPE